MAASAIFYFIIRYAAASHAVCYLRFRRYYADAADYVAIDVATPLIYMLALCALLYAAAQHQHAASRAMRAGAYYAPPRLR